MKKKPYFSGNTPCKSCPYRKDAPLQLWDKVEFEQLLENDKKILGGSYLCHKKDGSCCKGWLIDQDKRNFPSIKLRILLSENNVSREYLNGIHSSVEMFESIEQMSVANYPEIKL